MLFASFPGGLLLLGSLRLRRGRALGDHRERPGARPERLAHLGLEPTLVLLRGERVERPVRDDEDGDDDPLDADDSLGVLGGVIDQAARADALVRVPHLLFGRHLVERVARLALLLGGHQPLRGFPSGADVSHRRDAPLGNLLLGQLDCVASLRGPGVLEEEHRGGRHAVRGIGQRNVNLVVHVRRDEFVRLEVPLSSADRLVRLARERGGRRDDVQRRGRGERGESNRQCGATGHGCLVGGVSGRENARHGGATMTSGRLS
mmetsp:Transcript_9814/g.38299  ORF Transcript_9814/g.38299 Transcript_9814/m.38299 type:complete len:262 (+) Transcript_9814:35-820(+)